MTLIGDFTAPGWTKTPIADLSDAEVRISQAADDVAHQVSAFESMVLRAANPLHPQPARRRIPMLKCRNPRNPLTRKSFQRILDTSATLPKHGGSKSLHLVDFYDLQDRSRVGTGWAALATQSHCSRNVSAT